MQKHAKPSNPYAVDQHMTGAARQSCKACLPPLSFRALAGIAAQQINAIR
jgi:hypothetical protein